MVMDSYQLEYSEKQQSFYYAGTGDPKKDGWDIICTDISLRNLTDFCEYMSYFSNHLTLEDVERHFEEFLKS